MRCLRPDEFVVATEPPPAAFLRVEWFWPMAISADVALPDARAWALVRDAMGWRTYQVRSRADLVVTLVRWPEDLSLEAVFRAARDATAGEAEEWRPCRCWFIPIVPSSS